MVKDSQQLYASYPDLLDESSDDVDLVSLIRDLDAASATVRPPASLPASIEQALRERVAERERRGKRARPSLLLSRLPRHLGAVAAVLLALVLLTGVAYAVVPILSRAFGRDPGLQPILQANLGKEVNHSQTVDGFTVSIQRVYADANRVVIGYTVSGPPGRTFTNFFLDKPRLVAANGAILPYRARTDAGTDSGTGGYVMWYDAADIAGNPKELDLRLEIPGIQAIQPTHLSPTPQPPAPQPPVRLPGPFEFRFTVPFIPGRVAEVNQTVTAGGIPVTLERVVVTPTETRAFLRFPPPKEIPFEHWGPAAEIAVDGWDSREQGGAQPIWGVPLGDDSRRYSVNFPASLHDKKGEWYLTAVAKGKITPTRSVQQTLTPLAGPWVFRFTVP